MISWVWEVNLFAKIRLILDVKFVKDPLQIMGKQGIIILRVF